MSKKKEKSLRDKQIPFLSLGKLLVQILQRFPMLSKKNSPYNLKRKSEFYNFSSFRTSLHNENHESITSNETKMRVLLFPVIKI